MRWYGCGKRPIRMKLLPPGTELPAITAYSREHRSRMEIQPHRCVVIHYVSGNRPYCRKELPQWQRLVKTSRADGCGTLTIVPDAGDASSATYDEKSSTPIVFIPLWWATLARLQITPTTILLDANGACSMRSLQVRCEGAFSGGDNAIRQIRFRAAIRNIIGGIGGATRGRRIRPRGFRPSTRLLRRGR